LLRRAPEGTRQRGSAPQIAPQTWHWDKRWCHADYVENLQDSPWLQGTGTPRP